MFYDPVRVTEKDDYKLEDKTLVKLWTILEN